jgi:hypothetical protein
MLSLTKLILEIFDKNTTNKIKIGKSVLYGVVHGEYVQVTKDQYSVFKQELQSVNGQTFYEGPIGHEGITQQLLNKMGIKISAKSWEPSDDMLTGTAKIGRLVAGWWNQTLDDAVGLKNIKQEWERTGVSTSEPIEVAFKASVGNDVFEYLLNNFTDYSDKGRYSKEDFINALSQQAFNEDGSPTKALETFNLAGHDQVFPEDNNLPPGKLKKVEQAFSIFRDKHLIDMMKNTPGVYFAGSGHLDTISNIFLIKQQKSLQVGK